MKFRYVFIILVQLAALSLGFAQVEEGEIAGNFTIEKYGSDAEISLYDFEGSIIVLDFWAYWCGPCQTSSPSLESDVADYYSERGGTDEGVPVVVLAVSIDNGNSGAVSQFVTNAGMKLVGLDRTGSAWRQYAAGYVPTMTSGRYCIPIMVLGGQRFIGPAQRVLYQKVYPSMKTHLMGGL